MLRTNLATALSIIAIAPAACAPAHELDDQADLGEKQSAIANPIWVKPSPFTPPTVPPGSIGGVFAP